MSFEVVMPRLGWSMEKGTLVKWLKQDGEDVQAGEALFVVEADKASQEVEALESGVLRIPASSPPPGSEMPVGTLLGYILQPGEEEVSSPQSSHQAKKVLPLAETTTRPGLEQSPSLPQVERLVAQKPAISPRARRVAEEMGVNWTNLQGSGRTGRIVERDIRQAAARPPALVPTVPVTPAYEFTAPDVLKATSSVRQLIAERMATSAHTAAAVTLTTEADVTELVRLRKQLAADPSRPAPSYNDLFVKLLAQALVEHPAMNSRLEGDAIVQSPMVNVGITVDTDSGLLVPVLRDVQAKPLFQIVQESAAMIEAARAGRTDPEDLRGGTFTLTNLGMYDIDAFTPIINLPECAILGVGRIVPKQVVVDADAGRVAIRHLMFLSLTFDHRLVDGAPSARFLQRVKQYFEHPYLSLVFSTPARMV